MRTKNRVKELRIAKGYTSQREFANFVTNKLRYPISYGTINKLENQIGNPSWELLDVLATYFNVTVDYLMGRTNQNFTIAVHNDISSECEIAIDEFYKKMRKSYNKESY